MADTSARLLRLLSILQSAPHWTGPDLSRRLGVTTRTVRRDVDRLRSLGYPVDAEPGTTGGYRLGAGGDLPPLLFDDDEATAVAVALSVSAHAAAAGIEQPALAALAKLDRLLPPRLRARVAALRDSTVLLTRPDPQAAGDLLVELAQACAGHERVRLDYRDRSGAASDRRVDPYQLVATGRRWYLLAHDVDRSDWRTFRVDRIEAADRTGHRFVPVPAPDPTSFVGESITAAPYVHRATVRFAISAEELSRRVPPTVGSVRADEDGSGSILIVGSDDLDALAGHLVGIGLAFEVVDPPELRDHLRRVGRRLTQAHSPTA
jgi:predicted DNA-binding transcriptional regulator YafY